MSGGFNMKINNEPHLTILCANLLQLSTAWYLLYLVNWLENKLIRQIGQGEILQICLKLKTVWVRATATSITLSSVNDLLRISVGHFICQWASLSSVNDSLTITVGHMSVSLTIFSEWLTQYNCWTFHKSVSLTILSEWFTEDNCWTYQPHYLQWKAF